MKLLHKLCSKVNLLGTNEESITVLLVNITFDYVLLSNPDRSERSKTSATFWFAVTAASTIAAIYVTVITVQGKLCSLTSGEKPLSNAPIHSSGIVMNPTIGNFPIHGIIMTVKHFKIGHWCRLTIHPLFVLVSVAAKGFALSVPEYHQIPIHKKLYCLVR